MQPLSGLDASFLYLETPSQPLHVCAILELDAATVPGGYSFARLREELGVRIKSIPEFRQRLADSRLNLDHPVWVEDHSFDLDRHLHGIGLPAPGGRVELSETCGRIASLPLDRGQPLWEMWVIEGIAGTDARAGGRLAVMTKVHHASVDGVGGANLLSQLCGTEPDTPAPKAVDGPGDSNSVGMAVRGLAKFAARPLQLATVVPLTASTIVDTGRRIDAFNLIIVGHRRSPHFPVVPRRASVDCETHWPRGGLSRVAARLRRRAPTPPWWLNRDTGTPRCWCQRRRCRKPHLPRGRND